MNTFNFTAKIVPIKDTEKFHPVEKKSFSSGWENITVKFNCLSETNRVMAMAQGGRWKDEKKNGAIKTFSKTMTDENGNVIKGEKIEIPYNKRFDEDQIARVAAFRRYEINTGDTKMRYKLQDAINAFENDSITDEMIVATGCNTIEEAKIALEKLNKKRKIFITEYDFCEYLTKLLAQSEKFKDKFFYISGTYDVQYSAEKNRFYRNYHVNRITLASDDATPSTEMKIDFYFDENSWDDSSFEETGKVIVNGWGNYYDSNIKSNGFFDMPIVIREENEKKRNALKRKLTCEDGIKQIGLTLNVIEGAEVIELTMDMLDDETREDIEMGLLDWETVKKELGGRAVGDKVSELRFAELTPKKNVAQDTIYTVDDMVPAKEKVEDEDEDDDSVPFSLDDDDDSDDL